MNTKFRIGGIVIVMIAGFVVNHMYYANEREYIKISCIRKYLFFSKSI